MKNSLYIFERGQMKKYIPIILILSMTILTACGGEYNETGKREKDAVSSGAVSGAAVETEKEVVQPTAIKYNNSNSTNIYLEARGDYNKVIVQRKLDGTSEKILKPKRRGADMISVRYADDEWLYYTRWKEETPLRIELWRAPIEKKDGSDEVQFDKEEKVLVEEDRIFDNIYVAGDCVYYNEGSHLAQAQSGIYRKYDIRKQKEIEFGKEAPEQSQNRSSYWVGTCGDMAFFSEQGDFVAIEGGEEPDDMCGLYVQKASDNKFVKIDDKSINLAEFVNNTEQFFYIGKEEVDSEVGAMVKYYDSSMEKAEVYISQEQLQKAMKEAELDVNEKIGVERLCLDENKLYIFTCSEDEIGAKTAIFSCELTANPVPELEEKFYVNYFVNEDADDYGFLRFVDGKCLVGKNWDEEKGDYEYECFDLATGEAKQVTEKDAEYWWQYW